MKNNRKGRRFLSVILTAALCFGMIPASVAAEGGKVTVGTFVVTGGKPETDYSYSNGVLTVNDGADITISMASGATEPTSDRIVVNGNATITLNGVNITGSAYDDINVTNAQSAIDVSENATLILNLSESSQNTLTGGSGGNSVGAPGIHVPASSSLVIQGSGGLSVKGGNSTNIYGGNGIGGKPSTQQSGGACGTVIILATGNVTVTGGDGLGSTSDGVDIGGGQGTSVGDNGQGIRPSTDGNYTVYGDLILPCNITIPEGATVVIPNGASLTVPKDVTLTNNGMIQKDGGSFINDGTLDGSGNRPADDRYTINYAEETITIDEDYSLYDAAAEGTQIQSGDSITAYIGKSLYIQQTDSGTTDRTEIKIPARPAAPTDTVTIDYANEKITTAPNTDTSNWEYSTDTTIWQDVPGGMALSEMGWTGDTDVTYYFRTGATDTSFASSATTTPIIAPARPVKPADPETVEVTSDSITIKVVSGQEYRLDSSGTWDTLSTTDGSYTWSGLQPRTQYTIETRTPADRNVKYQFASHPASITVTTNYEKPEETDFTSTEPGKAAASWDSVDKATGYIVQLHKDSEAVGDLITVSGTTHTFDITETGTYYFTVKAVSDDVDGEIATSAGLTFHSVTFNTNGGSAIAPQIVANGGTVTESAAPTKSGFTFAGWFKDESLTTPWDFSADTVTGDTTLYAKWTENPKPVTPSKPVTDRISGDDRFETAVKVADQLKKELGVTRFSAIVVAYSDEFADALSASAFAQENEAPVLVVNENNEEYVKKYIEQNLVKGGKVYIMGGNAVVSDRFENSLSEFNVSRLGGADRYETNLLTLKQLNLGGKDTIIIASGLDYADALSASSTGLPVMIAGDKLTDSQIEYLKTLGGDDTYYIAGGTAAVSSEVEKQLKRLNLGIINRLAGDDRYETSALIAETFYSKSTLAYLASGDDFPDGLTGGVLAGLSRDGKGAPLLLVNENNTNLAASYIEDAGVRTVKAIGGTEAISDETLKAVI